MTRGALILMAAIALGCAAAAPVGAHHSIAKFDGRRVVKITGVVTGFRWINPHASIELDGSAVEGAAIQQWVVEMQAPSTLMVDGWKRDSLTVGDRITVFANPLRAEDPAAGRQRGLYVSVVFPDGSKLGRTLMSFREKTAWVTLCAMVIVSLLYWLRMPTPIETHSTLRVVHAMGASVLAYLLIEVVAWVVLRLRYPRDAREPKDERERLIDLKAIRIAYYVLAVSSMLGIYFTLHLVNSGAVALGVAVFMAFLLSQIAKHAARIVYYRRGF